MNTRALQPGDPIECNGRGQKFLAIFKGKDGPRSLVEPLSKSVTYRRIRARQIERKVESQGVLA